MPLVDDGIKYKSKNKKDGYELIWSKLNYHLNLKKKHGELTKNLPPY